MVQLNLLNEWVDEWMNEWDEVPDGLGYEGHWIPEVNKEGQVVEGRERDDWM